MYAQLIFSSDGKASRPALTCQERGEPGRTELRKRAQHSSPLHLRVGWQVGPLKNKKI